ASAESDVLTCSYCEGQFQGEWRKRNLSRHVKIQHGDNKPIECDAPGCERSYKRSDALKVHLRKEHPDIAPPFQPRK
ncbi:hypothetical protein C7974DRAFT_289960, partial [Boeremia exigua]|uniref:uncharacterized protein n=1 Tax=Boeremia exigua TaxID=749465 RepID=UPI001E8D835A